MRSSLNVFFEDPFWVGIVEVDDGIQKRYCRIVFGDEPSLPEIYTYVLQNFNKLVFTPGEPSMKNLTYHKNPKRLKKEISKELSANRGLKKSYDIIKQSYSEFKQEKHTRSRQLKKEQDDSKYSLKKIQSKEKHKGH
jgi:hypothetical protein